MSHDFWDSLFISNAASASLVMPLKACVLPYPAWLTFWAKCFLITFYHSVYNFHFLWLSIAFSSIILIHFSLFYLSLVMIFDHCSNEICLRIDYLILNNNRLLNIFSSFYLQLSNILLIITPIIYIYIIYIFGLLASYLKCIVFWIPDK